MRGEHVLSQNLSVTILGGFDGITCVLGVLAAGFITGNAHVLVLTACGLAVAEGVAMSGGKYLSEEMSAPGAMLRAGIIGLAAALGVFLPALPYIALSGLPALFCSLVIILALASVIAQVHAPSYGALRAYGQTYGILLLAGGLSVLVTLLLSRV